ncbi:MAG: ABATE domain-containing protein, partial [Actinomycetota bacterium]|nr:ABATE domain-containing protein [Actinomycetota bacterium]
MDYADYLAVALRLANADLSDVGDLQAALHEEPWWSTRATDHDLSALRPVRDGLRAALAAAATGNGDAVFDHVNALLAAHPPRPR